MCNRYRMSAKQVEMARHFGVPEHLIMPEPVPLPPPELFPKRIAWIVRNVDGMRTLDTKAWGIPRKMRGKSGKMLTKHITNVRNLDSPFWRSTLANPHYRCLVPFTTFAEPKSGKEADGTPANWWFTLPGSEIAAFAGIWRPAEDGEFFAFLTCDPNPLVAPLHPKAMPVILQPEDYEGWLTGEVENACSLAAPFPSQLMAVG